MKRKWRVLLVASILSITTTMPGNVSHLEIVKAEGMHEETQETKETIIQIVANDMENNRSLAMVKEASNGVVTGDGVRLRSKPSTSGAVLEKMYSGEYVWIDWSKTGSTGWYYLKRLKTGTRGWVSCDYISAW